MRKQPVLQELVLQRAASTGGLLPDYAYPWALDRDTVGGKGNKQYTVASISELWREFSRTPAKERNLYVIVHTNLVSHDGQDQSDRVGPFGSLSSIAQPPGCIDRLQWYELIKSEVTLGLTSMFVKAGFVLDLNDTNSIMFNFRGGITDDGFRVDVRWKINQENLFFMRMAEQRVFMVHYADAFKSGLTVKDWLPQHDMTLNRDGLQYLTIASCPGGLGEVFHHSSGNDVTQPEFGVSLPQFTFGNTPLLSEHMDTLDVDVGDHPHYNDLRVKVEEVVEQEEADLDDSDHRCLAAKWMERFVMSDLLIPSTRKWSSTCVSRTVKICVLRVVNVVTHSVHSIWRRDQVNCCPSLHDARAWMTKSLCTIMASDERDTSMDKPTLRN